MRNDNPYAQDEAPRLVQYLLPDYGIIHRTTFVKIIPRRNDHVSLNEKLYNVKQIVWEPTQEIIATVVLERVDD